MELTEWPGLGHVATTGRELRTAAWGGQPTDRGRGGQSIEEAGIEALSSDQARMDGSRQKRPPHVRLGTATCSCEHSPVHGKTTA